MLLCAFLLCSYGDITEARAERQTFLLERYKLVCSCPPCVEDSQEREILRSRIAAGIETNRCTETTGLDAWASDRSMPDNLIIAECLAMIKVLDEERLYACWTWSVWYQRLVKSYCALEDKKNA